MSVAGKKNLYVMIDEESRNDDKCKELAIIRMTIDIRKSNINKKVKRRYRYMP